MRKNYFVICVTMMCLLVLVGCTSLKVGTEVLGNTVTESQGQGAEEAETSNPVEIEDQVVEKPTETEKPEVQSSETVEVQENELVMPLPVTVNLNQLEDCTLAVSLNKGDVYKDKADNVQMNVTVFVYDLYDMVDISLLKEGDSMLLRQEEVVITSIERKEDGTVVINGGLDVGGYVLHTDDNTVYYERGYSDVKSYYELGKVTLPVYAEFLYHDASDMDKDAVIYRISDFLENAAGIHYLFNPNNTTITIQDGMIVEMNRIYTP